MSNLRKIGNKLFKETTELKSHEIELNLINDLKKEYNTAVANLKEANKRATTIRSEKSSMQGDIAEIMDNVKILNANTEKLESATKKIGLETPSEVALFKKFAADLESKYTNLLKEFY